MGRGVWVVCKFLKSLKAIFTCLLIFLSKNKVKITHPQCPQWDKKIVDVTIGHNFSLRKNIERISFLFFPSPGLASSCPFRSWAWKAETSTIHPTQGMGHPQQVLALQKTDFSSS
jgi:hypothetical protein